MSNINELVQESFTEEGLVRGLAGGTLDVMTFRGLVDSVKSMFGDSQKCFKILNDKIDDINYFIKQNQFTGSGGSGVLKAINRMTRWRFYFLLNDEKYKQLIDKIKSNSFDRIFVDANFANRVIKEIFSAKSNSDLLKVTDEYLKRATNVLKICKQNKIPEKQTANIMNIITQGAIDLESIIRDVIRYNS